NTVFSRDWSSDVCSSDLGIWRERQRSRPAMSTKLITVMTNSWVASLQPGHNCSATAATPERTRIRAMSAMRRRLGLNFMDGGHRSEERRGGNEEGYGGVP